MELILTPLDAIRLAFIRTLGPLGRRVVVDRELRVALGGCLAVCTSLLGALLCPLWVLALGPIVLGIPHLLSDVRYLVVRTGFVQRPELLVAVGVPLLLTGLNLSMVAGVGALLGAAWLARAPRERRVVGVLWAVAVLVPSLLWPNKSRLVLAHLHNAVALGFWWWWRPRERLLHRLPLLLAAGVSIGLMGGAFDPLMEAAAGLQLGLSLMPRGLDLKEQLARLAPGFAEPLGVRLVLLFCFAQSLHYAVWLRLIPDEARGRSTPRTFHATWKALCAELSPRAMRGTVLLCVALAGWALLQLARARDAYFGLALFHGYLELSAAMLLWMEGTRPSEAGLSARAGGSTG